MFGEPQDSAPDSMGSPVRIEGERWCMCAVFWEIDPHLHGLVV